MAQQLRTLAAVPKYPGSIPSTHMAAHNCSSSSKGPDTLTDIQARNLASDLGIGFQVYTRPCEGLGPGSKEVEGLTRTE